jgi:large subunit ribosomal protein L4
MRRQAIRTALSGKAAADRVFVVQGLDELGQKTKPMVSVLSSLKVEGTALVVLGAGAQANTAVRNIPRVKGIRAELINVLDLLRFDALIISPSAARQADELWSDTSRVRQQEEVA